MTTAMAPLRHGAPVSHQGWLLKEGANGAMFRRYMRLWGTALSNAHSETHDPSWQVCVLDAHFGPGTRPLELVVQLPKRRLSYFAESHAEYTAWVDVAQRAKNSDLRKYYELGKLLGEGGFAKVYAAHDRQTMTNCAVKVINKTTRDPAEMEYLLREMDIMMKVSHPNIVATFDIFDTPSVLNLVIDIMPGGELFDIVADKGHLSEAQASQVVREIIMACEYLHSINIVHCDIKPENILCKTSNWPLDVKLCDFGLSDYIDSARVAELGHDNTLTAVIGTPGYIAPEVVKREPYGRAVDMWACGVVLYVMLSGRLPFYGRNDMECLRRIANGEYSFPDREWKDISEHAISLVKSLLQVNPTKRLTARAALQHRWLATPEHNSHILLSNNLRDLHSSRRKFKKAVMGILTVQRMEQLRAQTAASGPSP
jgi:calcium/calmodulin-dependent protein kinase I